ncbi:TorD/DmsD family molecular chaperone [Ferrimonas marina]|uniref:Chaperone TorD involved in molybdoenzyme TorA maturation n=1 Tax=Ferrimonas marina TaxID=299255 RepID=A0A1M5VH29_9GAMM|nr:molecular chaperone TorD family protein [Ferrimonas marina]SHH74394.1 chaperone TorD involved in molybdoenzyme TorA maturation [Ferrimonas marina]
MDRDTRANLQAAAQVLHYALYHPPTELFLQHLTSVHADQSWPPYCPAESPAAAIQQEALEQLGRALNLVSEDPSQLALLQRDYQALFIGPGALKAIPWGSPYLHEKRQLCGPSTLALSQWLTAQGIELNLAQNEPVDHIGLLLSVVALLIHDPSRDDDLRALLAQHLLPWSTPMLAGMAQQADTEFYRAIAGLTQALLLHLQHDLAVTPVAQRLYL